MGQGQVFQRIYKAKDVEKLIDEVRDRWGR